MGWAGTCANGQLRAQALRDDDDQCGSCSDGYTPTGILETPTFDGAQVDARASWNVNSDAWNDRDYRFEDLGHFTENNFEFNIMKGVSGRDQSSAVTFNTAAYYAIVTERAVPGWGNLACPDEWRLTTTSTHNHGHDSTRMGFVKYNLYGISRASSRSNVYAMTYCYLVTKLAGHRMQLPRRSQKTMMFVQSRTAPIVRADWNDGAVAWHDRTYKFQDMGHFTSQNFAFNIETAVLDILSFENFVTSPFNARYAILSESAISDLAGNECPEEWRLTTSSTHNHGHDSTRMGFVMYNLYGISRASMRSNVYAMTYCYFVEAAANQRVALPVMNRKKINVFVQAKCSPLLNE